MQEEDDNNDGHGRRQVHVIVAHDARRRHGQLATTVAQAEMEHLRRRRLFEQRWLRLGEERRRNFVVLDNHRNLDPQVLELQRTCDRLRANDETLTELFLRDGVIQTIVPCLQDNTNLKKLTLPSQMTHDGIRALVEGLLHLGHNCSIETLCAGYLKMGDDGVRVLCRLLSSQVPIKALRLEFNLITNDGAKALASVLQQNSTLATLGLSNNKISDEGVTAICGALRVNQGLTWLNLTRNEFSFKSNLKLLEALSQNYYLESLCFYGLTPELRAKVNLYQALNRAGRKVLSQGMPQSLWPRYLAKLNDKPELIHAFLCENPTLMAYSVGTILKPSLERLTIE